MTLNIRINIGDFVPYNCPVHFVKLGLANKYACWYRSFPNHNLHSSVIPQQSVWCEETPPLPLYLVSCPFVLACSIQIGNDR